MCDQKFLPVLDSVRLKIFILGRLLLQILAGIEYAFWASYYQDRFMVVLLIQFLQITINIYIKLYMLIFIFSIFARRVFLFYLDVMNFS